MEMDDFEAYIDAKLKGEEPSSEVKSKEHSDKKRKHEKKEKKDKHEKKRKKDKKDKKSKDKETKEKHKKKAKSELPQEDEVETAVWVEKKVELPKEDGNETQEQQEQPAKPSIERESWMLAPPKRPPREPKVEEQPEEKKEEPPSKVRELNPYIGGLPPDEENRPVVKNVEVGDGGANWRARAVKRAIEMAQSEGRDVEEVLKERFGEDIDVEALIQSANSVADKKPRRERQHFGNRGYLNDDKNRMLAPSSSSYKWKRDDRDGDRDRDRDRDRYGRDDRRDRDSDRRRDGDKDEFGRDVDRRDRDSDRRRDEVKRDSFSKFDERKSFQKQEKYDQQNEESDADADDDHSKKKRSISEMIAIPTLSAPAKEHRDKNIIAAEMLKAKLKGDTAAVKKLEKELQEANREVVSGLDEMGRPIAIGLVGGESVPVTKRGKFEEMNKDGSRARYFRDDEVDLQTLVAREKLEGVQNYDDNFAKNIMKSSRFRDPGMDEFDDITTQMWESSTKKKSREKQERAQKQKAMKAHNTMTRILESCWFCFDNPRIDKDLIVSIGNYTYLALPKRGSLVEGHCLIIPMQHCVALNNVDEEISDEVKNFQKCLVKMFASQKRDVVFMEIATELKKQRHTYLEVIPLPVKVGQQAPIYFKKAIQESESEWSQHKKLIDMTGRSIKRSVPAGFPYFSVEFGVDSGYAHVIEDEQTFPRNFGREIIAGMLKLRPEDWMRPQNENPEVLFEKRKNFLKAWAPFDWTAELEGGEYD